MIVLLEPVYYSWVHEEVNAGMLKLISDAGREKVLYIGEREHIRCIRELYADNVCFAEITKLLPHKDITEMRSASYYAGLIKSVIKRYRPKHLFILGAFYPCILAAEIVSVFHPGCRFHVTLHGMVEPGNESHDLYKKLIGFCRFLPNLDFITYSPYCRAKYWKIREEKMNFIHHPFIKVQYDKHGKSKDKNKRDGDILRIGIIGACSNTAARKVVAGLNGMGLEKKLEFWVFSKFGNRFRNTPNAQLIDAEFDRIQMQEALRELDYILIPYGKEEYTMSASGVLWDAISNEVPCLMLGSKYLAYYNRYHIGYQAETISELCKMVRDKAAKKEFGTMDIKLSELEEYNLKKMRGILRYVL